MAKCSGKRRFIVIARLPASSFSRYNVVNIAICLNELNFYNRYYCVLIQYMFNELDYCITKKLAINTLALQTIIKINNVQSQFK